MNEEPPKDLATRAFQKRVLDEFAAARAEQASVRNELSAIRAEQSSMRSEITEMRNDITEIRSEIVEIRTQQAVMTKNIGALDYRLTSVEERIDARLKELDEFCRQLLMLDTPDVSWTLEGFLAWAEPLIARPDSVNALTTEIIDMSIRTAA